MERRLIGRWSLKHTLLTLAVALLAAGPASPLAWAATTPIVKPAAPKPATPVKPTTATPTVQGTKQLAGGVGQVGTTYTLYLGTPQAINYTIKKLEYSVGHFYKNTDDGMTQVGEKSLILHLTIQNPQKKELYISGKSIRFSGVDSKEQGVESDGTWYDEQSHATTSMSLKPAQKIDVYTRIALAGAVSLPKMIVDDSKNTVWRYDLRGDLPTDKSVGFSGNACVDNRYVDA